MKTQKEILKKKSAVVAEEIESVNCEITALEENVDFLNYILSFSHGCPEIVSGKSLEFLIITHKQIDGVAKQTCELLSSWKRHRLTVSQKQKAHDIDKMNKKILGINYRILETICKNAIPEGNG